VTTLYRAALAAACAGLLAGCMAPLSAVEARDIATVRMTKYCNGHCDAYGWSDTQRIKDRWLVNFESPAHKFTVIVERNGNAKVTTWDK
jgi:hypothetical protein